MGKQRENITEEIEHRDNFLVFLWSGAENKNITKDFTFKGDTIRVCLYIFLNKDKTKEGKKFGDQVKKYLLVPGDPVYLRKEEYHIIIVSSPIGFSFS